MIAVWVIVLIVTVGVGAFLMAYVFPHSFLKTEFVAEESHDRGLKNVKETTGRSIVYQPSMKYRKYVTQYVISERDGEKKLICKLADNVRYIDYDVVMFNGWRKAFNVVNSKELIDENHAYTEELELEDDVAYVALIVNAVNDEAFASNAMKPASGGKIASYIFACVGLTVLQVFLMKVCCSYIFGGVFREVFMTSTQSTFTTLFVALGSVIVNVSFIVGVILKQNRSKAEKGEK